MDFGEHISINPAQAETEASLPTIDTIADGLLDSEKYEPHVYWISMDIHSLILDGETTDGTPPFEVTVARFAPRVYPGGLRSITIARPNAENGQIETWRYVSTNKGTIKHIVGTGNFDFTPSVTEAPDHRDSIPVEQDEIDPVDQLLGHAKLTPSGKT